MKAGVVVLLVLVMVELTFTIMLRRICPQDEVHRSCSFTEEYTCWTRRDLMERVRIIPRRLMHCHAGCFCKRGLVRTYPGGKCLAAPLCRDQKLINLLSKLPKDFIGFP